MDKTIKWILLSVVGLISVFIIFNNKIKIWEIIAQQLKVYRNDKKNKVSLFDIFSFIIGPVIISVCLVFLIDKNIIIKSINTIITIFTIMSAILLSFLALLIDKKQGNKVEKAQENKEKVQENKKEKMDIVINETFITIIMTIIYSILTIVFLIILFFMIGKEDYIVKIIIGIVYLFLIKIVLNFLMILKRVFLLLE